MRQGPFRNIPRGEYSEVVLGFFDILGFSNLTRKKCVKNPHFLIDIFNQVDGYSRLHNDVEVRIVSDSIVLWCPNHELGLATIINAAALLQTTLLREQILIRGVIAKGKHYSTHVHETELVDHTIKKTINPKDEVIVSPVLVHCVEREKKIDEPIIVLDSTVQDLFETMKIKISWVAEYIDNFRDELIVNGYFTSLEYLAIQHKTNVAKSGPNSPPELAKLHFNKAKEMLHKVRDHIINEINGGTERSRKKWMFVRDRYDQVINNGSKYFPELSTLQIN